jgi:hypothetical protein
MPELRDSNPPAPPFPPNHFTPSASSAASPPPTPPRRPMPQLIPPEPPSNTISGDWEDWEGFRFTFLRYFPPEDVAALRGVAQILYDLVLEEPRLPADAYPPPETRWEMVAVLSELRFLQGFLSTVSASRRQSSLPPKVEELCDYAGGLAWELANMGDNLNEELAKWRE